MTSDASTAPQRAAGPWSVTAFCALLGLALGAAMSFVPYRFAGTSFRPIYDEIRVLGVAFSFGGALVVFARAAPRFSRGLRLCGQAVLVGALLFFFEHLLSLSRGLTGPVFYGGAAAFLLVEASSVRRRRALLLHFFCAVAALLGAALVAGQVSRSLATAMPMLVRPLGVVFLLSAAAIAWSRAKPTSRGTRAALAAIAAASALVAWGFGARHVWSGLVSYSVAALFAAAAAWRPDGLLLEASFRRRILLASCVAAFVPLLALGGVATYVAQQAIHEQLSLRLVERARAAALLVDEQLARGDTASPLLSFGAARDGFELFLVDEAGAVVARSSGSPQREAPAFIAQLLRGAPTQTAHERFDEENRTLLVAQAEAGGDLLVVAAQDVAVVYAPVARLGAVVVALFAAAAGVALLLADALSRQLARGLERFRDASAQLAEGRLDARVDAQELAELHALADAFNQMAARTEHAQAELARVNEELRGALGLRDQLVAIAGHELRTPLTSLGLALETARRRVLRPPLDAGQAESSLRIMSRQLERLTRLVDDLLHVARIQAGRLPLQRAPADLREVVGDVVERFASSLPAELSVSVEPYPEPIVVEIDAVRIDQVLVNLLQNAAKYSPAGGAVRVRLASSDGAATLVVEDQGIGIAPDALERVFEPFVRLESNGVGGFGLGLHICREIVVGHGGAIRAESEGPGRGSRFVVELPRRG